jgi:hypothetical protein
VPSGVSCCKAGWSCVEVWRRFWGPSCVLTMAVQQLVWFVRILRSPLGAAHKYYIYTVVRLSPLTRLGGAPSCLWNDFEKRTPGFRTAGAHCGGTVEQRHFFPGPWHLVMGRELYTLRRVGLGTTGANQLTAVSHCSGVFTRGELALVSDGLALLGTQHPLRENP